MEIINNTSVQVSLTFLTIIIAFYKELKIYKIFTLTGLGLSGTLIYFFILGFILDIGLKDIAELRGLKNNGLVDLGVFLGGVFSPIAFFWLIIGYLMQNLELNLTRKEYTKTVEFNEEYLKNQIRNEKIKQIKEHNNSQPILNLIDSKLESEDNKKYYFIIKILNSGAQISNFKISDDIYSYNHDDGHNFLESKAEAQFMLSIPKDDSEVFDLIEIELLASFVDANNNNQETEVNITYIKFPNMKTSEIKMKIISTRKNEKDHMF